MSVSCGVGLGEEEARAESGRGTCFHVSAVLGADADDTLEIVSQAQARDGLNRRSVASSALRTSRQSIDICAGRPSSSEAVVSHTLPGQLVPLGVPFSHGGLFDPGRGLLGVFVPFGGPFVWAVLMVTSSGTRYAVAPPPSPPSARNQPFAHDPGAPPSFRIRSAQAAGAHAKSRGALSLRR